MVSSDRIRKLQVQGVVMLDNDIAFFGSDDTPSDGTSGTGAGWAGKGSVCICLTGMYQNINTVDSPSWEQRGS